MLITLYYLSYNQQIELFTENSPLFDIVDVVYYINLDHRNDRRSHIESLFEKYNIDKDRVERISGVYNKENGAMGCTQSHIKTLKQFIKSKYNTCIIFEDDYNFEHDLSTVNTFFSNVVNSKIQFDLIQLTAHEFVDSYKVQKTQYPFIDKVIDSQSAACYIITKDFSKKILPNLEKGYKNGIPHDVYWKSLQPSSNWYVSNPVLGHQIESYSDILKKVVDYY